MFTVCPKCALTLVVTAADLRVAQGYVRCGRCSSVFNALARLADDRQAPPAEADAAEAPAAAVAEADFPAAPEPDSVVEPEAVEPDSGGAAAPAPDGSAPPGGEEPVSESALEFDPSRTDVTALFVEPPPDPQWAAATGSFKAMKAANQDPRDADVEVEIDSAFLASMLKPEAAPGASAVPPAPPPQRTLAPAPDTTPAPPPPPQAPAKTAATAAPTSTAAATTAPATAAPAATAPGPRTRPAPRHSPRTRPSFEAAASPAPRPSAPGVPAAVPAAAPPAEEQEARNLDLRAGLTRAAEDGHEEPQAGARAGAARYFWAAGVAVAALLLAAQVINHYRDQLAASARFNRPLTALYAALGVPLVPHWDLHAYDVRQLGADVDPGGTIIVRASIKNAAQQAQPLPLLRVTLQDRFGNRIASRDVEPHSYLPRSVPPSALLSAGQRIDAQMGFVDPGANAVGFELDACLPAAGHAIACANDTSTR